MVTAAPPPLRELAVYWDTQLTADYPSAVFSGIIPDADHLANGGYHVSIEDLVRHGNAGDYSNTRPLDRSPPVTNPDGRRYSAAMDMSMSSPDMRRHYQRVRAVYDDRTDPRRAYIGYVNTWDGQSASATRFDFQGNRILVASADHKWHVHTDFPRAYVDIHLDEAQVRKAMRAYLSVIKGESKAQWIADEEGEGEEEEMRLTFFKAGGSYWRSNGARTSIRRFRSAADFNQVKDRGDNFPDTDANGFPATDLITDPERGGWTWEQVYQAYGPDEATLENTTVDTNALAATLMADPNFIAAITAAGGAAAAIAAATGAAAARTPSTMTNDFGAPAQRTES
jgi:hypothetical protein